MKRILIIFLVIMSDIIFAKHTPEQVKFHKTFLKWEKNNITPSPVHKDFMQDFLDAYREQYELVATSIEKTDRTILDNYQNAISAIMNRWNFYYYHIPLQAFYDEVKVDHENDSKFAKYFKLYAKYENKPTDPNLRIQLQKEQKRLEDLVR